MKDIIFLSALLLLIVLTGCGNIDAKTVIDAVQLGPDECGTAELHGSLDVGGQPWATTTVNINIDKQKVSYVDGAGAVRDCD